MINIFNCFTLELGDRLKVGRQILALVIGVRLPVPELWCEAKIPSKVKKKSLLRRFFVIITSEGRMKTSFSLEPSDVISWI